MIPLMELWFPIVLSAVFVFIASSIIHVALPIHRSDWEKVPDEDKLMDDLRTQGLSPGAYMFPCAGSMKDAGTPEMIEKFTRGPVGLLTVLPSAPPAMGKNLVQWFLYSVLISILAAYVGAVSLGRGADYLTVFRVIGTVAITAHGISYITDSIWKGQRWGVTFKYVIGGTVYGLVTAGAFGWLWPAAV